MQSFCYSFRVRANMKSSSVVHSLPHDKNMQNKANIINFMQKAMSQFDGCPEEDTEISKSLKAPLSASCCQSFTLQIIWKIHQRRKTQAWWKMYGASGQTIQSYAHQDLFYYKYNWLRHYMRAAVWFYCREVEHSMFWDIKSLMPGLWVNLSAMQSMQLLYTVFLATFTCAGCCLINISTK